MRSRAVLVATVLLALSVVTGCTSSPDPKALQAHPWTATELLTAEGLVPVLDGSAPTVMFRTDNSMIGNATINLFEGEYTVDGEALSIIGLNGSEAGGSQMRAAQEALFVQALMDTSTYRIADNSLELVNAAGETLAKLETSPEPTLYTPHWKCVEYAGADGALRSITGTYVVGAMFSEDGVMTGSAGVNDYTTSATISADTMSIGPEITTTKMAGPSDLMAQETGYLAAILRTARWRISEYRLELLDADGAPAAIYIPASRK